MTILEKLFYTKARLAEAHEKIVCVSGLLKECVIECQQCAAKTLGTQPVQSASPSNSEQAHGARADASLPLCSMCECRCADCAYGDLRGGQSCIDTRQRHHA